MKTFKFGQLLSKEDICDREKEIQMLEKICSVNGRAVVYGPRRFGKTSIVKNVIMREFVEQNKNMLGIYADLFQLDSMADMVMRLQVATEHALSQKAKIKSFLKSIGNYVKNFRVEISMDELSGAPIVSFSGKYENDKKTLDEIFMTISNLSVDYKTLLILDEFQDIKKVAGLEGDLRSVLQSLNNTTVILLGSKMHILKDIFSKESEPFYGFGTDVKIGIIPRATWLPYMKERFEPYGLNINMEGANETCSLLRDVPNAIQELCQWISLGGQRGMLTPGKIHENLFDLIENKSSRYIEKVASFSVKEKKVLNALALMEPVSSVISTKFVHTAQISPTAIRKMVERFTDQGITEYTDRGYWITDPIFRLFLVRQISQRSRPDA